MRKITQFHDTDKPDVNRLLLAVDVSSQSLDLYGRYRQDGAEYEVSESFPNEVTAIAGRLDYYARQARGSATAGSRLSSNRADATRKNLPGRP